MEQYAYPPQVTVIPSPEEKKQIRKFYSKAAIVLLVSIAIYNGFSRLIALFINTLIGSYAWENEFFNYAFGCSMPILSEAVAIIVGIKLLGIKFMPILHRDNYDGKTVTKLVFLSLGIQTAMSYLVYILDILLKKAGISLPVPEGELPTAFSANLIYCLYVCIIGPILEEMLYRGVLLQSLRRYNERFAIFFSSLIFGLMHQNYQQLIAAFVFAIPLAVIAVKYNSILPTIVAHIICNTTAMLIQMYVQYIYPDYYNSDVSNLDLSALPASFMTVSVLNFVFRAAVMIAALVIGILAVVKGGYIKRPTPAGKSRAVPVIVTSVLWWVLIILYVTFCFLP